MKDSVPSRDLLSNKAKRYLAVLASAALAACSSDGVKTVQKTETGGSLGPGCEEKVVYLSGSEDNYSRGVVVKYDADLNAISSHAVVIDKVLGQIKNPEDGLPETAVSVLIPQIPPKAEDIAICAVTVVTNKQIEDMFDSK